LEKKRNQAKNLAHNEGITDRSGNPYQYFHYTAWGESFAQAEATQGSFSSSYRFNAKELDQETGNYYYGARYYHPKWSVWLGVDAMASQFPAWSPYNFSLNNPVNLVDPDGNAPHGRKLGPNEQPGTQSTGNHAVPERTEVSRTGGSINVTTTGTYVGSATNTLKGSNSNLNNISDHSAKTISTSMDDANVGSVTVNSTQRTPQAQAEAMYDNAKNNGVASQYKLYGSGGDQIIEVYERYSPNMNCSKAEAVEAMTVKMFEIGPSSVSKHIADPSQLNVIDLSTRALGGSAKDFHIALDVNFDISKILTPYNSTDPAFHIEIPQ
jgi:RHS repeat-associated protein